jgi:hypothetical protein
MKKILIPILLQFSLWHAPAMAEWPYLSGAIKVGYGTLSTPNATTVPNTKHTSYAADVLLGIRSYVFLLGASGEYAFWRQLDHPKNVSNVNSQGTYKAVYPFLGLEWIRFRLIYKVPVSLMGDYTFEKSSTLGETIKYDDPKPFSFQLHWTESLFTFWALEYQKITFRKSSLGGQEYKITDLKKLDMNSISILYGYYF